MPSPTLFSQHHPFPLLTRTHPGWGCCSPGEFQCLTTDKNLHGCPVENRLPHLHGLPPPHSHVSESSRSLSHNRLCHADSFAVFTKMTFQLPTLLVSPLTLSKQVVWLVPASLPQGHFSVVLLHYISVSLHTCHLYQLLCSDPALPTRTFIYRSP